MKIALRLCDYLVFDLRVVGGVLGVVSRLFVGLSTFEVLVVSVSDTADIMEEARIRSHFDLGFGDVSRRSHFCCRVEATNIRLRAKVKYGYPDTIDGPQPCD